MTRRGFVNTDRTVGVVSVRLSDEGVHGRRARLELLSATHRLAARILTEISRSEAARDFTVDVAREPVPLVVIDLGGTERYDTAAAIGRGALAHVAINATSEGGNLMHLLIDPGSIDEDENNRQLRRLGLPTPTAESRARARELIAEAERQPGVVEEAAISYARTLSPAAAHGTMILQQPPREPVRPACGDAPASVELLPEGSWIIFDRCTDDGDTEALVLGSVDVTPTKGEYVVRVCRVGAPDRFRTIVDNDPSLARWPRPVDAIASWAPVHTAPEGVLDTMEREFGSGMHQAVARARPPCSVCGYDRTCPRCR